MRKILFFTVVLFCISLLSCSKNIIDENASVQTTTNQNLRTSGTGITLAAAQELAVKFLQDKSPNVNVTLKDAVTLTKNGIPYFHIINTNAGWAILSADSLYLPILAYNTKNTFSLDEKYLNLGLKMWFNKNAHQMEMMRSKNLVHYDSITSYNRANWRSFAPLLANGVNQNNNVPLTGTDIAVKPMVQQPILISSVPATKTVETIVGPLVPAEWGQEYPFNQFCPADGGAGGMWGLHDAVGCVPLAMGEIMYFWKFPTTYNWGSMVIKMNDPKVPSSFPNTNPAGFVSSAHLLADIGAYPIYGVGQPFAQYTNPMCGCKTPGTNADLSVAGDVFDAFGYAPVTNSESLTEQGLTGPENGYAFNSALTNELQNYKRPCIISGFPSENQVGPFYIATGVGHTWVCSGSDLTDVWTGTTNTYKDAYGNITTQTTYTTLVQWYYLFMDFGYDGTDDAWYSGADYTDIASQGEDFKYFQFMVTNIHPPGQ